MLEYCISKIKYEYSQYRYKLSLKILKNFVMLSSKEFDTY